MKMGAENVEQVIRKKFEYIGYANRNDLIPS